MKKTTLSAIVSGVLLAPPIASAASFSTSPNPNALTEHNLSNYYCEGQTITITLSAGTVASPTDPCCGSDGSSGSWYKDTDYFVFDGASSTDPESIYTANTGTLSPSLDVQQKYICPASSGTKLIADPVTGNASWDVYGWAEGSDYDIKVPEDYSSRTESSMLRSYPIPLLRYPTQTGEYVISGNEFWYAETSGGLVYEGPVHFLKDMTEGQSCHNGFSGTKSGSLAGGSVGISVGTPISADATISIPGVPGVSISDPAVLHQRTIVQLWLAAIQDADPQIQLNAYKKTLNSDGVIIDTEEISPQFDLHGEIPAAGYYYDYSLGAQSCCTTNPQ